MESSVSLQRAISSSQATSLPVSWTDNPAMAKNTVFVGRIHRKLSLVFGCLFLLMVLGGGISLYLAGSLLLQSQQTAKQSEQVYAIANMHSSLHHFFSSMQRARLTGTRISESLTKAYLTDLKFLLASYEQSGGAKETVEKVREIIGDVETLVERVNQQAANGPISAANPFGSEELRMMEATEQRIQIFAHLLSTRLDTAQRRDIQEIQKKMKIVAGFNAVFILLATLAMMASSLYFYRAIALPLRRLAQAALQITDWKPHEQLPVTSKDEMGALSHALNTMAKELRKHEESLKGTATIEERERLAQELHDSIAQDLALIHLKLAEVTSDIHSTGNAAAEETVREVRKIAADSYENVRQAIFGLRTTAARNLPFIAALKEYLREFSQRIHIPVDLRIQDSELKGLSPLAEIQLIRIIHEALSNVFKHAQATISTVAFQREGNILKVTVEDNGRGFVPGQMAEKKFHFGLQTMKERAEALRGRCMIDSAPGKGTRVVVLFPFEEDSHETNPAAAGR
jgi:nitrate/nitrite-specific signal transduction histidine kinase